ncbi:ATP-binding protein, partial [Patescibacteria group bacterium]|nr:ATP-binding protein [Patescibacteria group bacterium]
KVKKLEPSRYILVTSVEFNPAQKKELKNLFAPYVLTTGDILGRDDLNGLLGKFSEIEEKHPKLWLSSIPILNKIVNNGIKGRSDFTDEVIRKNVSLYVANETYAEALEILNEEQFLVIVGEPGIGKTVLAKMLIYQLLGNDYRLVTVTEKISEAEDLWEPEQKQVFYFDDFLGANYLEIAQYHNGDSALVNFIARIKLDPLKRLMLTSRTAVLNQAAQVYPRLEAPGLELARHEVKIEDYSKLDKAQILYNHLYFLGLGEDYKQKVKEDKNYWKIIKHKNYNPRLIEFISDPLRLKEVPPEDYMGFIQERLDNPADIWKQAYLHQTDDYCKFLIQSLFSLGEKVPERILKRAFNARLDYEIEHNGFRREADVYALRLKHLMGGFLKAVRHGENVYLSFFNPSITDFLLHYLSENKDEKWRILNSVIFTSQLTNRFITSKDSLLAFVEDEISPLEALISRRADDLVDPEGGSRDIELLHFYYFAFPVDLIDTKSAPILERLDLDEALPSQFDALLSTLDALQTYDESIRIVKSRFREIINYLFSSDTGGRKLSSIKKLFKAYDESYEEYIADENSRTIVESALTRHWGERISDIEAGQDSDVAEFGTSSEIETFIGEIQEDGRQYNRSFGFAELRIMESFEDIDYDEIARSSRERAQIEDYMSDYHAEEYYSERSEPQRNENAEIDELFQ